MYIDTHAHLNFKEFKKDYKEVIERAFESNVKGIINIGSNLKNSNLAIKIAKKFKKGVYAAVGAHPIHIVGGMGLLTRNGMKPSLIMDDYEFETEGEIVPLKNFKKAINEPKVVAIGEIGLDYFRYPKKIERGRDINKEVQKATFSLFLDISKKTGKPVIMHAREAMKDFLRVLRGNKGAKGVAHCFPGNKEEAKKVLDLGFYISYTGLITFSGGFDEVVRYIPLDRMMIETDCPYMTPEPYRGKRNEPAYVVEVAKKITELKKVTLEKVEKQTTLNAKKLFRI